MNKKGFTLLEVVVSVVLVSLVLTAMLAALVKLKTTYETSNENTDALVFASSLTRIINNDFEENGGIRHIECPERNLCNIILNNNQKRRISIYPTKKGYKIPVDYEDEEGNKIPNTLPLLSKETNPGGGPTILSDYIYVITDKYELTTGGTDIYCEPKRDGEPKPAGSVEITDNGKKMNLLAVAKMTEGSNIEIVCAKEVLATTLKYEDTTDPEQATNIYLKTLSMEKTNEIKHKLESGIDKYAITGKSRTNGYNFGNLSYETLTYDNSNKTTGGASAKPYKNTLTTIKIEINNTLDSINSVQDIYLSSESMYSPDKQTTIGKKMCFPFDIVHYPLAGEEKMEYTSTSEYSMFCVKNGVEFLLQINEGENTKDIKLLDNKIDSKYLPYESDMNGVKVESPRYKFDGFYHNDVMVIDGDGNITVSTTYFTTNTGVVLKAKWTKI